MDIRCPLDGALETFHRSLYSYHYLSEAFDIISAAFQSTNNTPFSVRTLMERDPEASSEAPAGILGWSAIYANWSIMNNKKYHPCYKPSWERLCQKWTTALCSWESCPHYLPISRGTLRWFLDFLESALCQTPSPPDPPPSRRQLQTDARKLRKLQRAEELEAVLSDL